jgi:hypothetical protein
MSKGKAYLILRYEREEERETPLKISLDEDAAKDYVELANKELKEILEYNKNLLKEIDFQFLPYETMINRKKREEFMLVNVEKIKRWNSEQKRSRYDKWLFFDYLEIDNDVFYEYIELETI